MMPLHIFGVQAFAWRNFRAFCGC